MKLGSPEHKAQYCADLIKEYYENIWMDEIQATRLEEEIGKGRKALAAINLAIDNKEYKTKNEGEKAKFVAQRGIEALQKSYDEVTEKINVTWPSRIQQIKEYMEKTDS
jgi:hypothetical protein